MFFQVARENLFPFLLPLTPLMVGTTLDVVTKSSFRGGLWGILGSTSAWVPGFSRYLRSWLVEGISCWRSFLFCSIWRASTVA